MTFQLPHAASEGFDGLYGLELVELSEEIARGRVLVRDELMQPPGIVHSGVCVSIAEALALLGTTSGVSHEGKLATSLCNQTSFLGPITAGTIDARAVRKHRGRTTWVWEVEIVDDAGRLSVLTRTTISVRDPDAHSPQPEVPARVAIEGSS